MGVAKCNMIALARGQVFPLATYATEVSLMRVKLLSIFETHFTYIIQKFLELPSLLRRLSVIIYSERSGEIPRREIGERARRARGDGDETG